MGSMIVCLKQRERSNSVQLEKELIRATSVAHLVNLLLVIPYWTIFPCWPVSLSPYTPLLIRLPVTVPKKAAEDGLSA